MHHCQMSGPFYDSTRPYTLHSDDAFEQVVVQVPLGEMLAETGLRSAGGVTATILASPSPAGVVARPIEDKEFHCAISPGGGPMLGGDCLADVAIPAES
jgi:hypothetical protein